MKLRYGVGYHCDGLPRAVVVSRHATYEAAATERSEWNRLLCDLDRLAGVQPSRAPYFAVIDECGWIPDWPFRVGELLPDEDGQSQPERDEAVCRKRGRSMSRLRRH